MPGDDSKSILYEGWYQSGDKHGYGREIFPNGEYCVGQYDAQDGTCSGKYYWPNGTRYEGYLKEGKI